MDIEFRVGDVFDIETDGFISTGNVQLNMTGGINGALLQKYGPTLQQELHGYLKKHDLKQVPPGFIFKFVSEIQPYKTVLYCVGVDVWYNSSIELVQSTLKKAIDQVTHDGCKTAITAAMGTGYGKMSKFDFGMALRNLKSENLGLQTLFIIERSKIKLEEIIQGYNENQIGKH